MNALKKDRRVWSFKQDSAYCETDQNYENVLSIFFSHFLREITIRMNKKTEILKFIPDPYKMTKQRLLMPTNKD